MLIRRACARTLNPRSLLLLEHSLQPTLSPLYGLAMATGDMSGHIDPTQVPRNTLLGTSSRWDSGKERNPHKNRMRVVTADDGRRSRNTGGSLTGNAAPAARFTG